MYRSLVGIQRERRLPAAVAFLGAQQRPADIALAITTRQRERRRFASSSPSSPPPPSYSSKGDKLRVAVVGGGSAALSSALHLAPLVDQGLIAGPIDVFCAGEARSRDIGVGVWSTALDPFRESDRASHQLVYNDMTKVHGTWLGDVGYRTPDGAWLMQSHLPVSEAEMDASNMPALLFLRERDIIESLQKAVRWEEQHGTIQVHRNASRVQGLYEESSLPWSTNLLLPDEHDSQQPLSKRDYHLIIAADGMESVLRRTYGGRECSGLRRLTGTLALDSPIDLPIPESNNAATLNWDHAQREEIVGLQDRNYTVFRGNSNLTRQQLGKDEVGFQTWGTGRSMRFATVPMLYPTPRGKEERQVWFITIDNDVIAKESDPVKRRDMLLDEFEDWHDPIRQTVLATPPEEILMERAIAHRHCMGPVLSFNSNVVQQLRGKRPPSSGEGPCVVFTGDSYMTIDPILAQGFTCAMEGAAALRRSVEQGCVIPPTQQSTGGQYDLAFDPMLLRRELKLRQVLRMERLICLLRATELVQALGQPSGNASGILNTKVLRPLTSWTPNFVKAPIFDAILRYSLGLGLFRKAASDQQKFYRAT